MMTENNECTLAAQIRTSKSEALVPVPSGMYWCSVDPHAAQESGCLPIAAI
jgi:hypothetical protein